jgi:iron complex transport system substrate-binding protein
MWSAIATVSIIALVVGACDDEKPTAAPPTTTVVATASATASPAFPVTVSAGQGNVTINAMPQRIVSLSASLTEMLYAIDAGAQVAAVDRNSNYPADVPATDLSGLRPNIEAIARYEPDLVVLAKDVNGVVAALGSLGIPALLLPSAVKVDDVYREITVLGAATGHRDKAAEVVTGIRTDLDAIAKSVPARGRQVRYFYELTNALHSATSDTFIGELLKTIGLVSIADAAGSAAGAYPQLSNEFVLNADPDMILVAHTDGSADDPSVIKARPGWSKLQAVRNDRVLTLNRDIASRWGPRIVIMLRTIVDATNSLAN